MWRRLVTEDGLSSAYLPRVRLDNAWVQFSCGQEEVVRRQADDPLVTTDPAGSSSNEQQRYLQQSVAVGNLSLLPETQVYLGGYIFSYLLRLLATGPQTVRVSLRAHAFVARAQNRSDHEYMSSRWRGPSFEHCSYIIEEEHLQLDSCGTGMLWTESSQCEQKGCTSLYQYELIQETPKVDETESNAMSGHLEHLSAFSPAPSDRALRARRTYTTRRGDHCLLWPDTHRRSSSPSFVPFRQSRLAWESPEVFLADPG